MEKSTYLTGTKNGTTLKSQEESPDKQISDSTIFLPN